MQSNPIREIFNIHMMRKLFWCACARARAHVPCTSGRLCCSRSYRSLLAVLLLLHASPSSSPQYNRWSESTVVEQMRHSNYMIAFVIWSGFTFSRDLKFTLLFAHLARTRANVSFSPCPNAAFFLPLSLLIKFTTKLILKELEFWNFSPFWTFG